MTQYLGPRDSCTFLVTCLYFLWTFFLLGALLLGDRLINMKARALGVTRFYSNCISQHSRRGVSTDLPASGYIPSVEGAGIR